MKRSTKNSTESQLNQAAKTLRILSGKSELSLAEQDAISALLPKAKPSIKKRRMTAVKPRTAKTGKRPAAKSKVSKAGSARGTKKSARRK
ncbi:MAG: hypothetical protein HY651_00905 [Acidobacteria bacterium]|nr:hypothetical protein [Acidobacteriota bacterium]